MIVKEDLLAQLRRYFDLNLYEVKLWAALLSRGVSTAGELSDIADVPRSRSYDVLESLEKKGFVIMKTGKPIKYIAIPPTEVVDRVKKNMNLQAQNKINRLDSIKNSELLGELESLHKTGVSLVDPAELTGAVKGRHNLYNHMDMLIKGAKTSVNIMTTEKGFMRKAEGLKGSMAKAKKRGVEIKIAAPLNKENKKHVDGLKGIATVKHNKEIDSRFMTVDGQHTVMMTMDDGQVHPSYDMAIWVKADYMAAGMNGMFNQTWKGLK
ncbi:hypothetical protein HOC01_05730 [archaeon]|jgi:HTH-type transcriptional regulator, sugar sensing transcriptional regulator|nr:hypothetical protein [archaeon]MBT6697659.1 hypothetical protein [archaeon]